jgi:hypothetical protein
MVRLECRSHENRERAGQQPRFERRRARHLAVELHGAGEPIRYLDSNLAATRPPHAASFSIPSAQQQLEEALAL